VVARWPKCLASSLPTFSYSWIFDFHGCLKIQFQSPTRTSNSAAMHTFEFENMGVPYNCFECNGYATTHAPAQKLAVRWTCWCWQGFLEDVILV
jgi:hypothetical protein